ncbi:MFS transporter [Enemella evansiae]|nr:MFS transporter [Enemella evansiae]
MPMVDGAAGSRPRIWPIYLGGFLGPFGAPVVTTMLPELGASFGVDIAAAAASLTAYLVPFAALMLISGTLAEHWGRRRTVRIGYLVFALASIGCALAPSFGVFMAARVLQGAANAFTTPVLVAAITELVPAHRLGRSLGIFGSMQATGQAMAPLAGGLAAAVDWRLGFAAITLVSIGLALAPPPDAATPNTAHGWAQWRALGNRQLATACVTAALSYLTMMGVVILAALHADLRFGLGPTERGLAVAVLGVAGLASGAATGSLLDRYQALVVGAVLNVVMGLGAMAAGLSPWLAGLIVAIAVAGAAATGTRTISQQLAVTSVPGNRSGATSVMLACQFTGAALAPLIWVPLYLGRHGMALVYAGLPAIAAALVLLLAWRLRWVVSPR